MSEKITQGEQSAVIRRQVVWRNWSEQIAEKQFSVKTCTMSRKKEDLLYMEIVVASTKRERFSNWSCYEAVKNIYKQQLATLKILSFKVVLNNSNLFLPATNVLNHSWSSSSTPPYDQNPVLNFSFSRQLQQNPMMCSYNKTHVSPYDPTKLAIHSILRAEDDFISNWGQNFR